MLSVIILNIVMQSVFILSDVLVSVIKLNVVRLCHHTEYRNAEYHDTVCFKADCHHP
jgi:hypothetical protein